ncbi:hypothetical protein DASC09_059850 [Saccharomycopsis crataegensis]|uniref:Uncharacterized protein n=1 Tax=Saccharomycopsis crataegensis TaxID=43959 RepID=A0AAV5QVX0_9ASCO|nr:hypothetical protein DASC09_059850 [Saccharomycopsis crataegensis]
MTVQTTLKNNRRSMWVYNPAPRRVIGDPLYVGNPKGGADISCPSVYHHTPAFLQLWYPDPYQIVMESLHTFSLSQFDTILKIVFDIFKRKKSALLSMIEGIKCPEVGSKTVKWSNGGKKTEEEYNLAINCILMLSTTSVFDEGANFPLVDAREKLHNLKTLLLN